MRQLRVMACVSVGVLFWASAQAAGSDPWNAALSRVDQMVQDKVRSGVPSYSIAIVSRNHPTYLLSAGYADTARKIKATPYTIYAIGSVTKVFTGIMLMQMRDSGRASLDDPLAKHLPEFAMPSPFTGQAAPTLRQLASHTSGLPRMIPVNSLQEPNGASVPEMLRSLHTTAAVYPPLTHYKYSNLGVDLLGYALARTAGQSWPDYIDKNILHPLGMIASSAAEARLPRDRIAVGYIPSGPNGAWQPGPPMPFTPLTEASGSIMSSAADMAKFVAWQMDDSDMRVLTPLSRREMRTPNFMLDDWSAGVGITWFLQRFEGEVLVHHTGGTAGFTTVAAFVPKDGIGIVVLTNSTDGAHGFARELLSPVLAVAKAETQQAAAVAAASVHLPANASALAGTYLHDKSMLPPLFVAIDKAELVMNSPLFGHTRLIPTRDPKVFTATDNEGFDGETISFEGDHVVIGHGAMVYVRAPG
jgi:CubicO group peptidase (beta-lactamase class C family)